MRSGNAGLERSRHGGALALALLALLATSCGGGGDDASTLPRWGEPVTLAHAPSSATPQVVIDARGTATVVWTSLGGHSSAARGSTADGWTTAVDFEPALAAPFAASTPPVAAGSQTVATWINRVSPDEFVVRASAFETTWLPADTLTSTDFGGAFDIAGSDGGHLLAVWTEFDGTDHRVVSSRKAGGGPWVTAGAVSSSLASSPSWPAAAINSQGDCMVLWLQGSRVMASRLPAGSGAWTPPVAIENSEGVIGEQPQIVALRDGRFVAAWVQAAGGRLSAYGSSLTVSGWQRAVMLEHDDRGDVGSVHVAREGPSAARAVWTQSEGGLASTIHETRFGTQGWDAGSRAVVSLQPSLMRYEARVVSDRLGNSLVAWQSRSFGAVLSRIEYTYRGANAADWAQPRYLSDPEVSPGISPALAINDDGQAVVAWTAVDGTAAKVVVRLLQP
jgi:hypothetical protein